MPIGAHVSTAGGLSTCVARGLEMGIECMQIFLSPPQRWQAPKHSDEQVDEFCRQMANTSITPSFAHAAYLVNMAAEDPGIHQRSIDNLLASTTFADRIGLKGVVVHVGSGLNQTI